MMMKIISSECIVSFLASLGIMLFVALFLFSILLKSEKFENLLFAATPVAIEETSERYLVSHSVRSYFFSNPPLPDTLFTERERKHLGDVKALFKFIEMGTAIGFVASVIALLAVRKKNTTAEVMRRAGAYGFLTVALGGGAAALFFDQAFFGLHTLIFSNDVWQLDPAKHALIRAYPEGFFYLFFTAYVSMLAAVYGALWFAARRRRAA
ncbi:MAG: TIGR01906 family membrane protein [Candidatus Komeilibacteria bacterium]|nr:TIGR01906 family membrane protein [Candidatus Komeilibacteria bacterium]